MFLEELPESESTATKKTQQANQLHVSQGTPKVCIDRHQVNATT